MSIDTDYIQSMATQLAQYDVQSMLSKANRLETNYNNKLKGINELDSALKKFQTSVKSLKSLGSNSNIVKNKTSFNQEGFATASTQSTAISGSYDFFVKQLATRHQTSLNSLTDESLVNAGTLTLTQGDKSFTIDLADADQDASGKVSLSELVIAINGATDNTGIKATLVRSEGSLSIVLASEETGEKQAITLSSSNDELTTAIAQQRELTPAQDALVYLGGENGIELKNSKNNFDNVIDGVSVSFTKTHQPGETPVTLTVEQDQAGSLEQVKKLVDAYNDLLSSLSSLTASGGDGKSRGILAGDSGVNAIKSMLNNALRSTYGGVNIIELGISATTGGQLQIDNTRFNKMLAESPDVIDKLFSDKNGLINTLEKNLAVYTSSTSGILNSRKETINQNLKRIDADFDKIQQKYDSFYMRYLKQYTNMAQLMASMQQTSGMF